MWKDPNFQELYRIDNFHNFLKNFATLLESRRTDEDCLKKLFSN
jgi:hypothetical protein